jgi:Flp pilus assembly protein TadG
MSSRGGVSFRAPLSGLTACAALFSRRMKQRGAETVEFIFVLPVALLLLFGIVELSVAIFDQAILANSSRAAAREAIRAAPPDGNWGTWDPAADARQAAADASQRMVTWHGPETLGVQISPAVSSSTATDTPITVTLTYPYQFFVLPHLAPGIANFNLTAATVMRVLPRHPPSP